MVIRGAPEGNRGRKVALPETGCPEEMAGSLGWQTSDPSNCRPTAILRPDRRPVGGNRVTSTSCLLLPHSDGSGSTRLRPVKIGEKRVQGDPRGPGVRPTRPPPAA